eukprot:1160181-Pelagomonas_calceolata.AAC.2
MSIRVCECVCVSAIKKCINPHVAVHGGSGTQRHRNNKQGSTGTSMEEHSGGRTQRHQSNKQGSTGTTSMEEHGGGRPQQHWSNKHDCAWRQLNAAAPGQQAWLWRIVVNERG